VKSPAEVDYLRRAAAIGDAGMAAAVEAMRPGRAENEVNADIQHAMWTAGTENPPFPTLLGTGPRAQLFHAYATDRRIEHGDAAIVELMGVKAQYTANLLRTVVAGRASQRVRDLHEIVLEAFWRGAELARPGTPVGEIDRATRRAREVYARWIPGRAGFGVGIGYPPGDVGPSILEGVDYVCEPGFVFSLEPSIAQYDGHTIVFGNCIHVTADGPELLHKADPYLLENL
jgi:Xaa-Pro dipeptidase